VSSKPGAIWWRCMEEGCKFKVANNDKFRAQKKYVHKAKHAKADDHPQTPPRRRARELKTPKVRSMASVFKRPAAASLLYSPRKFRKDHIPALACVRGHVEQRLHELGLGFIVLESPGRPADTWEATLAMDHILLTQSVVKRAVYVCRSMVTLLRSSGAQAGDELWDLFVAPSGADAARLARAGDFEGALGELLGLLLFVVEEDCWLMNSGAASSWPEFAAFFENVSFAWAAVLREDDATLGLAPADGRAGGYRARILGMLLKWQRATNKELEANFDSRAPTDGPRGGVVRVLVVADPGASVPMAAFAP